MLTNHDKNTEEIQIEGQPKKKKKKTPTNTSKTVRAIKDKKSLRNCHRPEEAGETC